MSWIRAWARQPLWYFVLLGAAVFAIDVWMRHEKNEVHVSLAVQDEVRAQLEQALKRPPTPEELATELDLWVDTELWFREAEAMGLGENDGVIRSHLARKLQFVVRERTIAPEPSEAELRARFDANRERYTRVDTFDVSHVFLRKANDSEERQERVAEALEKLSNGAELGTVGDDFPRGPSFKALSRLQLEQALGSDLTEALRPESVGKWQTVTSPRGTHLVRLDVVHSGAPDFDAAKRALIVEIEEDEKQRVLREFTRELRKKYRVVGIQP